MKTLKPRTRALRALANRIEVVPNHVWNMGSFCGTRRCAFGHAPEVALIRKLGLRYKLESSEGDGHPGPKLVLTKKAQKELKIDYNQHEKLVNDPFIMATKIFNITHRRSVQIFGVPRGRRDGQDSQAQIANHIRKIATRIDQLGH